MESKTHCAVNNAVSNATGYRLYRLANGAWTNVAPGEVIVEQGEVGDAFYAIRSGQVEVVADGTIVRTLGPGSYFGEVALLLDVPRTASVVAKTPVRAYRLGLIQSSGD